MSFKNKNKTEKIAWLCFWGWAVFMLIMSVYPKTGGLKLHEKKIVFRADYVVHFISYSIFIGLYLLSSYKKRSKPLTMEYLFIFGIIAYSFFTEVLQKFIPSRSYNIFDGLSNVLGVIFGYVAFLLIGHLFFNRND